MATKTKAVETVNEPKFTKEAFVNSKWFMKERDLVSALLEDGEEYTISEVKNKIEKYMKGKVN